MIRPLLAALVLAALPGLAARAEITRYGAFVHDSALPHVLIFRGEIDRQTLRDFRAALRAHEITLLLLDSPGGRIYPSLALASQINARGLATLIPPDAECASACAFLFVAGTKRQAEGRLGVHRFTSEDDTRDSVSRVEEDTQETVAAIISLLTEQGTAPRFFIRMFETSNSSMYWFSPEELAEEGIVTGDSFAGEIAALERLDAAEAERAAALRPAPPGLPASGAHPAVGPGFDCAQATTGTEALICADGRLATLDLALTKRVERLSQRMTPMAAARLRIEQLTWLARRNTCAEDAACIETSYLERLDELGY